MGRIIRAIVAAITAWTNRIFNGDYFRENVGRHLPFIVYIFILVCLYIGWGLTVEDGLARIKRNDAVINDLKIEYHQKDLELIGLNQRSRIERMLIEDGNDRLHAPTDPPERITIR